MLSVLQLAVPAWDCLLTAQERTDIERVLRTGLRIIWGEDYLSFDQVLLESKLKTMQQTRDNIVQKLVIYLESQFNTRSSENGSTHYQKPKYRQGAIKTGSSLSQVEQLLLVKP